MTKLSILIVRLIFLVFFLHIICLDFHKLRDSLFIFSQSFILDSYLLILVWMRSIVSLLGDSIVLQLHDEVEVSASKWKVIDINLKKEWS